MLQHACTPIALICTSTDLLIVVLILAADLQCMLYSLHILLLPLQIFISIQMFKDLHHQYTTDAAARDVVVLQITAVHTQAEAVKTTVTHLLNELNRQATTRTADVQSQHTQLFSSRQHSTDSSAGTAHTRSIVAAVSDAIRGYTAQPQVTT
jgi:hypothetical protein